MPEERDSLLLFLAHANEHKMREKFSIVTGWEAERVGSRAQVLSDALVRSKQQYCAFRRCHLFKKHSLTTQYMSNRNRNCNRELKISTVSTNRAVNVYPGSRLTEGWYLNGSYNHGVI